MADIFISYIQEDGDVAREIAGGLEQAGYSVWYYERDSLPGHSYLEQILEVLDEAQAVVVIISPATLGSSQVNVEISEAHVANKPFAPLLRNLTYATLSSRRRPWTMMFGTAVAAPIPEEGVGAILPRLVRGLQALGVEPRGQAVTGTAASQIQAPRVDPVAWARSMDRNTAAGATPMTPTPLPVTSAKPWYRRPARLALLIAALVVAFWFLSLAGRFGQWQQWNDQFPGAGGPLATQAAPTPDQITVEFHDTSFEPSEITIPANRDVTLTLRNDRGALHNFSIDALGVDVDMAPDTTAEITVHAAPGSYEYYSNLPGQRQAGMVGTVIAE